VISPLALVGPTASGKTEVAVRLAEAAGAEIVCIDSMTVYRGMDVGTAKPTEEQRDRVPHHLLDLVDPAHPFSVAEFQSAARAAIDDIAAREAIPLLVGGSGLYFRALVDDLEFPPTDPTVRARLQAEDPEELRVRLKELDPEAAVFIDPANVRRVVRALEVIELTGRPFSSFRSAWMRYESRYDLRVAGIEVSPDALRPRIEARVRSQIEAGLLDEVRGLLTRGYRNWLTSTQAIPYRQAVAHVDGAATFEEFLEEAVRTNRRLARRQMAWFRRDPRVRWFDGTDIPGVEPSIRAYLFDESR
jgi:tRNA dimethylallyltransferase